MSAAAPSPRRCEVPGGGRRDRSPRHLIDVVRQHLGGAFSHASRGFYDGSAREVKWISFAELGRDAFGFARRIRDALPCPDAVCMLHDLEPRAQSTAILAAMAAGTTPLVLPRNALDRDRRAFADWVGATFDAPPLLVSSTPGELGVPYPSLDGSVASVTREQNDDTPYAIAPLAYLQCTSATTGSSKVARITHDSVLCNVDAIRASTFAGPDEVVCSWLPLYHDMGLVGCELFSLVHGYRHVSFKAYDFLRRPNLWLKLVSQCAATMSPAPNFGYQYAADHADDDDLGGVSLSTWRVAFNGAEPVRVATMRAFVARFGRLGFRPEAFCPSYGLAEATLAVSLGFGGRPKYAVVAADTIKLDHRVRVIGLRGVFDTPDPGAAAQDELFVTSCGRPVAGVSLSLAVGAEGAETRAEDTVGEIVVRGESVFQGYAAPSEPPTPGEVRTGDLGFLHGGELFIVDRLKNIVIINGVNHPCSDLEERVARMLTVPPEAVMVLDGSIAGARASVIAVVEGPVDEKAVAQESLAPLSGLLTDLIFVKRRTLPKTTSGKKQHHLCRSLLASGALPIVRALSLRPAEPDAP